MSPAIAVIPRSKADENHSARLTAGFCWLWSNPNPDGTLVPDVTVGAWQMPWNAKPDAGRLAKAIPPSNFWASDAKVFDHSHDLIVKRSGDRFTDLERTHRILLTRALKACHVHVENFTTRDAVRTHTVRI
jgi:hypothetical protein